MADRLSLAEIRVLAETAFHGRQLELAYAASAAGLERTGPSEARFLLLRAQALPPWEYDRRRDCLSAAAELARRQGDNALAGEAIELRRGETMGLNFLDILDSLEDPRHVSITAERVDAVLMRERSARSYIPPASTASPFEDFNVDFDDEEELDEDFVPIFGVPGRRAETPPAPAKPRGKRRKAKPTDTPGPEQRSLF
jgi:hypothetical protein